MKLTQRQIRRIIKEELESVIKEQLEEIQTVGQLKQALQTAVQVKKKNLAKDQMKSGISKFGWELSKTLLPGVGLAAETVKDVYGIIKGVYGLDDKKRTNTALDYLNVDDQVSAVVDDRVENQFIKDYMQFLDGQDDEQRIENLNMTKLLTDFIKQKYNSTTVEPGN
tara:strand:+ start:86 stop:586 length:501 start_codon:yes stop_codon:yes gene_type:complete